MTRSLLTTALLSLPLFASSCTLVHVHSRGEPSRIESSGLIDGHAAVGIRDTHRVLHIDLFDGSSPGAIGEVVLWKLARLEVGLAGLAVGLGPFDLALGTLFYEPRLPRMQVDEVEEEEDDSEAGESSAADDSSQGS